MSDADKDLVKEWEAACKALAAARTKAQKLHKRVQDKELGPYSPDARWSAPAEKE